MSEKLWGGRFTKGTNKAVEDFHSSIRFDQRLFREDIDGSIAHAAMLGSQGIIPAQDADRIVEGLTALKADIEAGRVCFDPAAEDIHMNVETLLTGRIGEAGKRLHTGRSRNDQVALDARMYALAHMDQAGRLLDDLLRLLCDLAEGHLHTVMPGYTHLQKAQPVTLAHHLMAYAEMFARDKSRFADARGRADEMPLGSGALAGTTYPLDRQAVAAALGFSAITANSLDGVADRDFLIEYLSAASLCMVHLSRFCEELILWSSHEFGFVEMDDAFSTGSSIMPQKKNPDVAELVRGKTGRVCGHLTALLMVVKGLPLAYNKDLQEDKEAFFDAVDTLEGCLELFTAMLASCQFRVDVMRRGAEGGFTNATDAADYLVTRGLPFRAAHEVVGRLVLHCIQQRRALLELSLSELQAFSPLFQQDVFDALSIEACVSRRRLPGGPAPEAVAAHIARVRVALP